LIDNIRKFSKILVAIDGSEPSMEAADYAIVVAKQYDAALVALHVLPEEVRYRDELDRLSANTDVSSLPPATIPIKGTIELSRWEAEENWFSKIRKNARENSIANFSSDVVVANKSVVAEIVSYAESNNIDLIVIGTRGKSGFKKLLLGSVASGVVTYAHCPVLVIK
jgi:nucleotide-binding universal stress UspA family protein